MRIIAGCLLSAFMVCFFNNSFGQGTTSAIKGRVLTENNLPADACTIILLKYRDSSLVSSTAADKNGMFRFSELRADNYILLITGLGYQKKISGPFAIARGQVFTAPDIIIRSTAAQLKEVTVMSTRPEIEAKPGKLVINVQSSILAQGSSAFDILRQSPGVRVDNGNNISIIGRQNAMITIDDKPTNLSGEDLVAVLKGMPANSIDRIELITSGSAKYDASTGGIINIVLKKGKNTGFNGSVSATAGYGRYYKSNAGVVFNNRTKHFNLFGNYNFRDDKNFHDLNTEREINYNNLLSDYTTDYNSIQKNKVHSFGIGSDFYLSSSQTLGVFINGSVTDDNFVKDNNLNIYNQSVFDSLIMASSNLNRHISRINYNVNYEGKVAPNGATLSADLNYTTYDRSSAEYITNTFYDAAGYQYRSPLLLQNLSPSNITDWLGKIDFSDPISKTSKLDAGIKFSKANSSNDLIFGPLENGAYVTDPNFSSHFDYNEQINAAYATYQNQLNKLSYTAGMRVEQTIATGNSMSYGRLINRNYTNLFPQLLLNYSLAAKKQLSLSYNRGITRPGYEDINPFLYYIDLYDYRAGNPNLKPEYSDAIELSYVYNKNMITTLYTSVMSGAYEFRYYVQDDTTKVDVNAPKNFGKIYNYGARFLTPATFTGWWNADFRADASYQRYVAYPAYGDLNKGTADVILSTNQYFTVDNWLSAEIFAFYETPGFYGISRFKSNYFVDIGISKQILGGKGSLKFSADDIFNTKRDRFSTMYGNLNMQAVDKKESQIFRLTFIYRLGKTAFKSALHRTGNEEEQNRMNNGNDN